MRHLRLQVQQTRVQFPQRRVSGRATGAQAPRKPPQSRRWLYGAVAAGTAAAVLILAFVSFNRGGAPEPVEEHTGGERDGRDRDGRERTNAAPAAPDIEAVAPAAPAAGLATLSVGQLPPGTRVSIDGTPVGTVGADGRFQYTSVKPGRHTVLFSRESYEPVTLSRDFSAARPVQVAAADVTFRSAAVVVEFLADAGTNVVVSQGDQTLHQFAGAAKLPLAEGTYQVVARGPANLPTTETVVVKAGATRPSTCATSPAASSSSRPEDGRRPRTGSPGAAAGSCSTSERRRGPGLRSP